jgi:PAS domain S-box-containing protein
VKANAFHRAFVGYGVTAVGVLVALGLTLLLRPFAPHFIFLFFLWVVVWSALYGGSRLALLSIALSAVVADYFILPPGFQFSAEMGHLGSLGLFIATALVLTAAIETRSLQVARRQRALEESEARFKGIIGSASDAIISIDADQRIVLFNTAAEQMFQCTAAEAIGRSMDRFIPERFRLRHQEHVRRYGETGVSERAMNGERVVTGLRANGEEFPAEANISQLEVAGRRQYTVILRDISERKEVQEALRRAKDELEQRVAERTMELQAANQSVAAQSRYLEAFFQHSITPLVFLDRNFNFIWVNAAYAKACRREVSEFPGHNHFEFYPHAENQAIFETVVRSKTPYVADAKPFEFPDHPEWGVTYWDWTLVPVLDSQGEVDFLVFSLEDVTARHRAEVELRKHQEHLEELVRQRTRDLEAANVQLQTEIAERRHIEAAVRENEALERVHRAELETLIEAIPAPVWMASDPACLHMTGNRAARDLLRAGTGQNLSRSAPEVERPRFEVRADGVILTPEELPMQRAAATGKPVLESDLEIVVPDGTSRFLYGNAVPLMNEQGAVRGCVGVFVDITERRRAEAALKEAAQRKDEFLAMLAHELRNPLAPIRNAVHLLRLLGPGEPKLIQARDLIDRQVTHMVRLIDDLLDVSRITRGTILLRKERVALAAIVEQAIESVRPTIVRKGHTLTLSCTPEPITVEADPARLIQVIANLLNNAAKFTEPGGAITLTTERSGGHAIIRVRDTGVGIAPELLPRIFDLFVQGEVSLDRAEGGLGIGLTLARHLVEQHGGHVEARSAGRGCGSEFVVTWPAVGSPMVRLAYAGGMDSAGAPERPLQVMVVEDNVDAAESFSLLLELQGHGVRAAHTGRAALDLATTFVPDVAFIDIGLPGLDGYEVARRFRAMPAFQATVLVALSGYGRDEDKCRAQDAGFDHHLTKPVEPSTIDRLLNDIAGRSTQPPPVLQ